MIGITAIANLAGSTPLNDSSYSIVCMCSHDGGYTWSLPYAIQLDGPEGIDGIRSAYSDNRVYVSRDKRGEKLFFTYNDTRIDGEINNQNPNVLARGFDVPGNTLTSDHHSDEPNNVTWLCDIMNEAYFQCSAPFVFTSLNAGADEYTIPIAVQWFPDAASSPTFKYIPDFSFSIEDFTVDVENLYCWVHVAENQDPESDSVAVYPVPVNDFATLSLNLNQSAHVLITVKNALGQQVLSVDKGVMPAGKQEFILDASRLGSGIYFLTVMVNEKRYTRKLIMN